MDNTTYASSTTTSSYNPPFDETGVIVNAVILLPLAAFGIVANVITIVVITTSPKLKSMFNYFILSLCCSDLTSSIVSPLFTYRRTWGFDDWKLSVPLCKIIWGLDIWTSYVTSTHILLFAMLRFVSVQWPHKFNSIKTRQAKITICTVWAITFCIGFIPFAIMFNASKRDRSLDTPVSKWPSCTVDVNRVTSFKLYTYIAYSIMFFVPIVIVIILSMLIGYKLHAMRVARSKAVFQGKRKSSGEDPSKFELKRRRKENQILVQLFLIVGSFLLGYVPQSVFHFYTTNVPKVTDEEKRVDWWLGSVTYIALRLSECLNPIFYNLASGKMRKETKAVLRGLVSKFQCWKSSADFNVGSATGASSTSAPNNLQL